jgi:hypothetical protein
MKKRVDEARVSFARFFKVGHRGTEAQRIEKKL